MESQKKNHRPFETSRHVLIEVESLHESQWDKTFLTVDLLAGIEVSWKYDTLFEMKDYAGRRIANLWRP